MKYLKLIMVALLFASSAVLMSSEPVNETTQGVYCITLPSGDIHCYDERGDN